MGEIPKEVVKTICSLCNSAKLESIKRVDATELVQRLKTDKDRASPGCSG